MDGLMDTLDSQSVSHPHIAFWRKGQKGLIVLCEMVLYETKRNMYFAK